MKKTFTLLFTLALLTTAAVAQDRYHGPAVTDRGYNTPYNDHFKKEKDMQIARINREYDFKIQAVKHKLFMSRFQKQRQISILEAQRKREIDQVLFKNNDRRGRW